MFLCYFAFLMRFLGLTIPVGAVFLIFTPLFGQSLSYTVSTVAGQTRPLGDGGLATAALLYTPQGVAVDTSGNIYFSDQDNHRVRKIDTAGRITTVAGTGVRGYTGDGGPATAATMYQPYGLAFDKAGNLYIADYFTDSVRKVAPNGIITTFAGTGVTGFSGDGGAATSARLNSPYAVVADNSGNVYIADAGNNRVRKVSVTGVISTFVGTGTDASSIRGGSGTTVPVSEPHGLAVDASGNLYVSEYGTERISKVDPNGNLTPFAGNFGYGVSGDGGPALSASFASPQGLAVDGAGNLYVADSDNNRIRKITPDGIVTTVAGGGASGYDGDSGTAGQARFFSPFGVATDNAGNVYVSDTDNHRIRKINVQSATVSLVAGGVGAPGDGGAATSAQLFAPNSTAVDAQGYVYIADTNNHRVRRVTPAGVITTVAGTGVPGFSGEGGAATAAQLFSPQGVAIDSFGQLLIADTGNQRIRRIGTNGIIQTIAGTGVAGFSGDSGPAARAQLSYPSIARSDAAGNLYIADTYNSRIRKISTSGTITTVAGSDSSALGDGGQATVASLYLPSSVAVDSANNLYIADPLVNRIRVVAGNGIITTLNGSSGFGGDGGPVRSASFALPFDVTVDNAGNLYVADSGNGRIRKVTTAGTVTTIAGSGSLGFSGDGGPALNAGLGFISGVAVDSTGSIYLLRFR